MTKPTGSRASRAKTATAPSPIEIVSGSVTGAGRTLAGLITRRKG